MSLQLSILRPSVAAPSAFAVIVGVSEYRSYDASGARDLPGARNDAIAWWRQLVLTQGFPPENVMVLASPPLRPRELGRTRHEVALAMRSKRRKATGQAVTRAYGRLYRAVATHGDNIGVFTWAGHGSCHIGAASDTMCQPHGLVLCPSDYGHTEGRDPVEPVKIEAFFAGKDASVTNRISFLLDACYAAEAVGTPQLMSLRTATTRGLPHTWDGADVDVPMPPIHTHTPEVLPGRIFLAAHLQCLAHEVQIGGLNRGAWTWSMISLMEQWRQAPIFDGQMILHPQVRHRDIVFASRSQLDLLNLSQVPRLAGPPTLPELLLFQSGNKVPAHSLSDFPDATTLTSQLTGQINGIVQYEILATVSSVNYQSAMILAGRRASNGLPGKETWYTRSDNIGKLATADSITIEAVGALRWTNGAGNNDWSASDSTDYTTNISGDVSFAPLPGPGGNWQISGASSVWDATCPANPPCNAPWSLSWNFTPPSGAKWFTWNNGSLYLALCFAVSDDGNGKDQLDEMFWAGFINSGGGAGTPDPNVFGTTIAQKMQALSSTITLTSASTPNLSGWYKAGFRLR